MSDVPQGAPSPPLWPPASRRGTVGLLLNGAGLTVDSSSFARALSVTGTVTLDNTKPYLGADTYNKPQGGGVSNNRLVLDDGDAWVASLCGAGEWCLETRFNPTAAGSGEDRILSLGCITMSWASTGVLSFNASNIGGTSYSVASSSGAVPLDTWASCMLIRDNTTDATNGFLRLALDGVVVASSSSFSKAATLSGTGFAWPIGYNSIGPGGAFAGLRLTAGTRRYLTNAEGAALNTFTPDPYPFT